jgi:hypothetical protein
MMLTGSPRLLFFSLLRIRSKTATFFFAKKNPFEKNPLLNQVKCCPNLSLNYANLLKTLNIMKCPCRDKNGQKHVQWTPTGTNTFGMILARE